MDNDLNSSEFKLTKYENKTESIYGLGAIAIALVPQAGAQNTNLAVVAWGNNGTGQSTVPGGLTGVAAIAAGERYSLALVADTNQNMAPAIVLQASGNSLLLSWPLSAPGFALQSTTNLTDNNSWTTLTNLPVIFDSQNRVTDTISGPAKFYQLKK